MNKQTASSLMKETKPFLAVRALVQLVITLIMLGVGILSVVLVITLDVAGLWIAIFLLIGLIAFLRLAKHYVLYMIKAAHVSAITEIIKTGTAPVTASGYQGVVAYGTEMIKNNFGAANVAFVADALIAGATRQIMRWVNKAGSLFSWIPGGKGIMQFVELILSTALNFIDEAILSYVFFHRENTQDNAFKKACDGLGYYAQSWKSMLKGALKVGVMVWVIRAVTFFLVTIIVFAVGNSIAVGGIGFGGLVAAIILAFAVRYGIEAIIVEPYATCIMINDYHKAIEGQPLKANIHSTLCTVSKKFRELFDKSAQPQPQLAEMEAVPVEL